MTEESRLTAKEAAEKAAKYLAGVKKISSYDISLEEIELTSDKKHWLITLGIPFGYLSTIKEYKVLKVDSETGEIIFMKIRKRD